MGLVSGIIMGILFGLALVVVWTQMMHYRSAKRVAKAIDIKLLGSLNRDDLAKICGDNYPGWISFPLYEQVKWINKQLSKIWPFVADAATVVIRDSVEPLLEDYRPPGISSLKFSKLSLGNVAPKIEGIRVHSLEKSRITMDIDLRWGGDPSIILSVGAAVVASLPIQLKDLQVFTVVRVIFQLAEDLPCISAVAVALLSEPKPRIDYILKAVGGSLTALPGISDMIDDTVTSIVHDQFLWPHRIVVPIGGIPVDTSDLELKPQGKLLVTVVKASDLKNMELIGKSDPYVELHIRPRMKVKTKVIDDNLNPVWNETFVLTADDKETESLILEVFDKDVGHDKKLGIAKLPLIDLELEKHKQIELRLLPSLDMHKIKDEKDRGTLIIEVMYHQFNKEEQLEALEEEKRTLEERKRMKEAGVIGSTLDALDGATSFVGSGVGLVGSGIGAGVGLVGTGIGTGVSMVGGGIGAGADLVGSGIGAGAGMVGKGIGAGVGIVGTGIGAVGSGLTKAGKFMGKGLAGHSSSSKHSEGAKPDSSKQN
ncbi:hypothetical protein Sjap_005038 [Stephania japonica]|uniref:Uncharacterized protein n=1 Tax=Stephania japonica TaxID=461633 RepID=A0AAP0PKS1_9MAGN